MCGCVPAETILRCEDAGGAIEGGEGLVELRHVPADRRFALDQIHRITRVGDLERGLDAGDAAAHDQGRWMDRHVQRFQRLILEHALHTARDHRFGFIGGRTLYRCAPTRPARGSKPVPHR